MAYFGKTKISTFQVHLQSIISASWSRTLININANHHYNAAQRTTSHLENRTHLNWPIWLRSVMLLTLYMLVGLDALCRVYKLPRRG